MKDLPKGTTNQMTESYSLCQDSVSLPLMDSSEHCSDDIYATSTPWTYQFVAVASLLIYAFQCLLGYFVMLITMTYCTELFLCVIAGLIGGQAVFMMDAPPKQNTDPCCNEDMG